MLLGIAEKISHHEKENDRRKVLGIADFPRELRWNEKKPDEGDRNEGGEHAALQPAEAGGKENRREEQEPNKRLDPRPEDPLQSKGDDGKDKRNQQIFCYPWIAR
jgi:hypothetical protein